ncbi:hypothetical protein [Halobacteriovorax sp.]|uniref:hypothetical protein n=1 Tax=Halobacteriovorax sp. TaxID=2020862 RepID=UPI0035671B39
MKRLIFSLIFIFALILIVYFYRSTGFEGKGLTKSESPSYSNIDSPQSPDNEHTSANLQHSAVSDECQNYIKNLSDPKFENLENRRWSNYHIKYVDGEIYRIRYFYDDGPNGEYKKTVLYKEDETEFPLIVKTFRGFEKEELKDYFDRGEVIWQEQAYETILNEKSVYWRKINNEFVDLNVDEGLSCL